MKAYVLITAEMGQAVAVRDRLRAASELDEVAVVSGVYDLVAAFETDEPLSIGRTVLGVIQGTEGVLRTVTLLELL